jgi:hypothetical protein
MEKVNLACQGRSLSKNGVNGVGHGNGELMCSKSAFGYISWDTEIISGFSPRVNI